MNTGCGAQIFSVFVRRTSSRSRMRELLALALMVLAGAVNASDFGAVDAGNGEGAPLSADEMNVEGTLVILFGDPPPGSGLPSQTIYSLHANNGRDFVLDLSKAKLPPEGIHSLQRKRVRVRARPQLPSTNASRAKLEVLEIGAVEHRPLAAPDS